MPFSPTSFSSLRLRAAFLALSGLLSAAGARAGAADVFLSTAPAPVLSTDDVVEAPLSAGDVGPPAEGRPLPPAQPPEEPPERPRWLERVDKAYAEGIKAQETGDARLARKRFAQALKVLADNADPETLLSLKGEITALFSRLTEQWAPLPPPEAPAPAPTLAVTEQELRSAPPAASPPVEDKNKKKGDNGMPLLADDPLVKKFITLYTTNPQYRANLQAAFNRMALYRTMILKSLKDAGLPHELVYLPLVESEYQPGAMSRAGAVGLWQFMAVTGRNTGLNVNYWVDERLDPDKCTKAALAHLKDLHDWFQDWPLALAAYNRGIYGLNQDMESTRAPDFASAAKRQSLPAETELYVPKFMALALIGENAQTYGFTLPPAQILTATDEVPLSKPLDLKIAAQCAGTTEAQVRVLNPTLRLWCTPKNDGTFALRLPGGTKAKFLSCLDGVKDWTPASDLFKYRVKQGDYLGRIATRYKTTVSAIMRDNRLANPKRLKPGQVLLIRPGRGYKGE